METKRADFWYELKTGNTLVGVFYNHEKAMEALFKMAQGVNAKVVSVTRSQ